MAACSWRMVVHKGSTRTAFAKLDKAFTARLSSPSASAHCSSISVLTSSSKTPATTVTLVRSNVAACLQKSLSGAAFGIASSRARIFQQAPSLSPLVTSSSPSRSSSSAAASATPPTSVPPKQATAEEASAPMSPLQFRVIPQKSLHVSTPTWWLESRFHFSFAEYFNPANQNFGVLRVLNDDLVQPRSGFGRHPHRNMEILTYVVDGKITHKDSMGTEETLDRGCVQYMSAGTGVTHSEMNNSDELLRFLQIWIVPKANGLKPNYGSRQLKKEDRQNKLQQVVTSFDKVEGGADSGKGLIPIHQDVAMFVSEMDPGFSQKFALGKGRQAYGVCIEGGVTVEEGGKTHKLEARDAFEVVNKAGDKAELTLNADASAGAHVFIIEMKAT